MAEKGLSPLVGKRQYLLTYSRADLDLFPTRRSFGEAVEEEFNAGSSVVKVDYWACCLESHADGGYHYHCSVKLTGAKKWLGVRNRLSLKYNIQVNFSDKHDYYLSSYRYVCKSDPHVEHSAGHPVGLLQSSSPRTKKCSQASKEASKRKYQAACASTGGGTKKSRRRLSNMEASELVIAEKVKSYDELLALAETRKQAGQNDLAEFMFSRNERNLHELVTKTWAMQSAKSRLERQQLSRMDILHSFFEQSACGEPCDGKWLKCAKEVLELNNIPINDFTTSITTLLEEGRGKHKNILLVGPRDCAKTFLLKPLQEIFKGEIFQNPAKDKYGWIGADKARVILLNDFRWCKELIEWKDLLLLLEGEPVRLPAPKNLFSEDVEISTDVPIFATSKSIVKYRGSFGLTDEVEDEMMNVRWKVYRFHHSFSEEEKVKLDPCAKCFCDFIFTKY